MRLGRTVRHLLLSYYVKVGIVWTLIAVIFDYLFIVLLLQADCHRLHVFIYYALTLLIPVGVGLALSRFGGETEAIAHG